MIASGREIREFLRIRKAFRRVWIVWAVIALVAAYNTTLLAALVQIIVTNINGGKF